jgi:class 3 adenylate cyclase/tetratricopeptide (TPR) repeat protein
VRCGAVAPGGARFCGRCGAALSGFPSPGRSGLDASAEGDRRHLTVLFSDIADSAELAARLDPEEWRESASAYERAAAEAVTRFGGHVAQFVGDGIVAYFGYPEAQENAAERAVRAGLAILDAIAALNQRMASANRPYLHVRAAIHSGAVVVGAGEHGEAEAFGETPNIAARVQAMADRDALWITAATNRLAPGLFVTEELGSRRLKGIAEPLELFRVLRASGVRGRLRAAASARGLTPFAGREAELEILWRNWQLARQSGCRVVTISGDPGIGKSRLVQEFRQRLGASRHSWIECAAAPFYQNTPFFTVVDTLQQALGWRDGQSDEERLRRLERGLANAGMDTREAMPILARMLNLPPPEGYPPSFLAPEGERRRQIATFAEWLLAVARQQPTVLVVDDLHWADPSTLELLAAISDEPSPAPFLMVCIARTEFIAPWPARTHHAQLPLGALSLEEAREMASSAAPASTFTPALIAAMAERGGGVPLFVEELARAMAEGGDAPRNIPATLRDSLMARLDRLGKAKEIAQVGAAIGHEFSYDLMSALAPLEEPGLSAALARLADAAVIYARGAPPSSSYLFRHALLRETAYEAMLKSARRGLHGRIARAIIERMPALAEARPEILAHHYSAAGESGPALDAWRRAGKLASARGALVEAEQHYRGAIDALGSMPPDAARDQLEIVLQLELGQVSIATHGYMAAETSAAYERARVLVDRLDDPKRAVQVLSGLFALPLLRGEVRAARAVADQVMAAANRDGSPARLAWARHLDGVASYHCGDLARAAGCFASASALYRESDHRGNPQDPGAESLDYAALAAWQLGRADTARARMGEALALAERLGKPYAIAHSRFYAAFLHALMGQRAATRVHAESLSTLARERNIPHFLNAGEILRGWSLARDIDPRQALEIVRDGLNRYTGSGNRLAIGIFLALLADVQAEAGAFDDALRTIAEAIDGSSEQLADMPFLFWFHGDLALRQHALAAEPARGGIADLAERRFNDSIDCARRIGAVSPALRAATGLARLLASQGSKDEARSILAPWYGRLVEGFDTRDAAAARELLDRL